MSTARLVGLYIRISMRHGRRRGLGEGIFSDVEFLKEVMADGLTLHHSVFLSLSLSLFVKPERCRQRLPAAPSVAVKCPKFISGERQGRQGVREKKSTMRVTHGDGRREEWEARSRHGSRN